MCLDRVPYDYGDETSEMGRMIPLLCEETVLSKCGCGKKLLSRSYLTEEGLVCHQGLQGHQNISVQSFHSGQVHGFLMQIEYFFFVFIYFCHFLQMTAFNFVSKMVLSFVLYSNGSMFKCIWIQIYVHVDLYI